MNFRDVISSVSEFVYNIFDNIAELINWFLNE